MPPINIADLQNAFTDFFNAYPPTLLATTPTEQGKIYELYMYSLVCESIAYLNPANLQNTNEFYWRQGPGGLNNNFGYFQGTSPGGNLIQVHNDVQFVGVSGMFHEIDICAVIIAGQVPPPFPSPTRDILKLAFECKSHENSNALKGEARNFLGLMMDLSNDTPFHPNQIGGCVFHGQHFFSALVTNVTQGRQDVEYFLNTYNMRFRYNIVPGTLEETALQGEITTAAQLW